MVLTTSNLLCFGSVIFCLLLGTGYCSTLETISRTEEPHILEIICNVNNIKKQSSIFFENKHNQRGEVQRNGTSCNHNKGTLPIVNCGCNLNNNAVCNVSMSAKENTHGEEQCGQWRCSAAVKNVLRRSDYLQVCITAKTIGKRRTVKCLKDLVNPDVTQVYPDVTHWKVEGRILNSNANNVELMKFSMHNITLRNVAKEYNGSIFVCKLEEEDQPEWAVSIIYLTHACSEVTLSKQLSRHTLCGTGNPTITELVEEYSSTECPSVNIKTAVNVTLCDAFNRDDMGAKQFLGNKSGSFKLEVLNPAIVRKFYVEEFGDQTNITLNETRSVTFKCDGDGNPPPTLTFISTSTPFITRYSFHLEHTINVISNRDTDTYLCIASNGLGNDSKSIYLDVIILKGEDGSSPITIPLIVGSALIILSVVLFLIRRRCEVLKIVHRTDLTIELATAESDNRTDSSPQNKDTSIEGEGSQNETGQAFTMSTGSVHKTTGFCNKTYAVSKPSIGKTECTADGLNDHNKKLGNETTGVAVQTIPRVYNELYAHWGKPPTATDHTKKKDYIRKEQSYKTRQNKKELEDSTYSVVNKNTRKHRDHASKDSVSSEADTIGQKKDCIYSLAMVPNEKDSAV